jgi:hypothetical protein
MSRNASHTLLVAGALAALFAAAAAAPLWAREQPSAQAAVDTIDDGSDAGDEGATGSWMDGALAVHEHRSIHITWLIDASVPTGPTGRALEDERERVSMNGGRRL